MSEHETAGPVRGGSLADMAWDLKPAADTGDDCLVHAPSVYDALRAAEVERERYKAEAEKWEAAARRYSDRLMEEM